jgi:hypothetical protein
MNPYRHLIPCEGWGPKPCGRKPTMRHDDRKLAYDVYLRAYYLCASCNEKKDADVQEFADLVLTGLAFDS